MVELKTSLLLLEELSESGICVGTLNVLFGDLGPENMSVHGRIKDRWLFWLSIYPVNSPMPMPGCVHV